MPPSVSVPVIDAQGQRGTLELSAEVFGEAVRVPLVHQGVVRELADRRAGTHATRGRSQVSGGGRKPWRQKGTGRARQGSIRATQWKGGGKPFGPKPRDYSKDMPRAMRRGALRDAIAARIGAGGLTVVERCAVDEPRTRALMAWLRQLSLAPAATLLVVSERTEALARAARNIPWLEVETPDHVSVYQVVRCGQVVFERAALMALQEALAR
jgi:large subunit ribosomal protein L4